MKKLLITLMTAVTLLSSPVLAKMPAGMTIVSSEKFSDNGNEGSRAKGYTAKIKATHNDGSKPWIMDYVISCTDPDLGPNVFWDYKEYQQNISIDFKRGPDSNATKTDFQIWVHFCKK